FALLQKVITTCNVLDFFNETWFWTDIDSEKAAERLLAAPAGSFLFRPASAAGCIALSWHHGGDGTCHHVLIGVTFDGFQVDGRASIFVSLAAIVEATRDLFGLSAAITPPASSS